MSRIDTQHEAIKRLIQKRKTEGLAGEDLLEYIIGKACSSNNKRATKLWLDEFGCVFEAHV